MPLAPTRPSPRVLAALVLLALLLALLPGCRASLFWALNRRQPAPESIQSATYDAAHRLALDVHRARGTSARGAPVVVFLHGGSWQYGRRQDYRFVGQALASHGVLAIVPDYRKAPAHPFPEFMDDAAAAVAWAHAHAREWGGDPSRLFVAGHSAGAHMAALLGTDARYLRAVGMAPRDLHGVVGLSGPYDFLPLIDANLRGVFGDGPRWRDSQPVAFVDGDEPPFLLLHGGADELVPPANSEHLARLLRARRENVELRIVAGVSHFGMVRGFAQPGRSPALAETLRFVGADDDAAGHAGAPSR
jgi:acetyl esterase/lipase